MLNTLQRASKSTHLETLRLAMSGSWYRRRNQAGEGGYTPVTPVSDFELQILTTHRVHAVIKYADYTDTVLALQERL